MKSEISGSIYKAVYKIYNVESGIIVKLQPNFDNSGVNIRWEFRKTK